MKIEVVLGDVGHSGNVELAAQYAPQLEAMGRNFHHDMVNVLSSHVAKGALEFEAFGGRVYRWGCVSRIANFDRADEARAFSRATEDRLHQVAGARLAIGSGNAD